MVSMCHWYIDDVKVEKRSPLKTSPKPTTTRPLTSDFSYNAMLQSYARKVDRPLYGGGDVNPIAEDGSYENIESSDVQDSHLQLAQDMNFEVVDPDDYISPATRTVRNPLCTFIVIIMNLLRFLCPSAF